MRSSYRAMQVTKSGTLELVSRSTPSPQAGQVLVEVEACGICGADVGDIERYDPSLQPPRVPGHEVVGRIAALGDCVSRLWKLGQRVGIGRLAGYCNECSECRRGTFELCQNQLVMGSTCDGGYAEMVLAQQTGLVSIPEDLNSADAAPILCAGIATFNALKKSGAQAGDLVAVHGIGGLGHMAVQYAQKMGFEVVALGRGSDIAEDVHDLGAHHYIDTKCDDATGALQRMGGARAILTTAGDSEASAALVLGLAPQGTLVVLSTSKAPLPIATGYMVRRELGVIGSITGSPYEIERALAFSVLADIRPQIEVLPLERANEAYQRMKSGQARFRMVLAPTPRHSAQH